MNRVLALGLLGALLGLTVACSSSTTNVGPSPTAVDVTGVWSGQTTFEGQVTRMVWTLAEQPGGSVTGTMFDALPSGTVLLNGSVTGTVVGTTLNYVIAVGPGSIPTSPTCTGQLTGSMQIAIGAPSTLTGALTVAASSCAAPFAGATVTLTR